MKKEFEQFMSISPQSPKVDLSEKTLSFIQSDLQISPPFIFFKLFWIHLFAAGLTLSFCPQFNIGMARDSVSSALYSLMQVHPLLCAAFCGTIFLGATAVASVLVLKTAELWWLRKRAAWIYSLLVAISLGFFMLSGNVFEQHYDFSFVAAWSITAILIAWLITRLGVFFRTRLLLNYN